MNYKKIYDQLISNRQKNILIKNPNAIGEIEYHHIIPLCLKGPDIKSNIVGLTPREHYIAHVLLWKIYPENYNLHFAIFSMAGKNPNKTNKRIFHFNSRLYEAAKKKFSLKVKEYYKTHDGSIKGKQLVFNTKTNSIEYYEKNEDYPLHIIQVKMKWIHSNELKKEIEIPLFQEIPNGWELGRLKNIKAAHSGQMMISNLETHEIKYVDKDSEIPDGWKKGRWRESNCKKLRAYHKKKTDIYISKAKEYCKFFVANGLSFTKLVSQFPELKSYRQSNYILQLFNRYVPEFDLMTEKRKYGMKKSQSLEGSWNNSNPSTNSNQHDISRKITNMA